MSASTLFPPSAIHSITGDALTAAALNRRESTHNDYPNDDLAEHDRIPTTAPTR